MTAQQIIKIVTEATLTTIGKIRSKNRTQPLVSIRQILQYRLRTEAMLTFREIGFITMRNEQSVMNSVNVITSAIETNDRLVNHLLTKIQNYERSINTRRTNAFDQPRVQARMHVSTHHKQGLLRPMGVNRFHATPHRSARPATVFCYPKL
jgi:hypothetical protein